MSQIEIYGSMEAGSDDDAFDETSAVCYKHKGRLGKILDEVGF